MNAPTITRRLSRLRSQLPSWLVFVVSFMLVGWFNGRRLIFEADRDEGYALIQSLLVSQGHPLYLETWSDQPPGYTYLILGFTKLFGETPEVARLLTAGLLSAFLAASYEVCRRSLPSWSAHVAGVVAVLSAFAAKEIFRYGAAAMIGLPALSLVGLAWASYAILKNRTGAVLCGAFLGLGLAVKPLGAPAVPAIVAMALYFAWQSHKSWRGTAKEFGFFALSSSLVLAIFFWPVFMREGGEAVYETHAVRSEELWVGTKQLWAFIQEDSWLFIGCTIGMGTALWMKRWEFVCLGAWLLLGSLALATYQPIWSHHRYLIILPALPLIGFAAGSLLHAALNTERAQARLAWGAALAAAACLVSYEFPKDRIEEAAAYFQTDAKKPLRILARLEARVVGAKTIATSRQMLAYRLGLLSPPDLAVTSRKRFSRQGLSAKRLTRTVLDFDADIVTVDRRWPKQARGRIIKKLKKTHQRVHKNKDELAFARKSLIKKRARK